MTARLQILIILLVALLYEIPAEAQRSYPKNYFRSPVDYPLSLSGSYGEIRKNHFHSGIDIRTGGAIGKPVYAVADGYVSRINISPYGFGKTIYVQHPNGYTSVYAHLNSFRGEIAKWTKNQQYKLESFAIDLEVPAGALAVRKGEVIASSGNSGSSGGPHLHFEIRDGASQEPLDPLEFGIPIADKTKPQILRIRIYPAGFNSTVNFSDKPVSLPAVAGKEGYTAKFSDTVQVSGKIVFGIEAYDHHDGSTIKNGIKSIEMFVDGSSVFEYHLDRFAFSETRYVNALLDYPLYGTTHQRVLKMYVSPNNKLKALSGLQNNGTVSFTDRERHTVRFVVMDLHGNSTNLSFPVKSNPPASVRPPGDPSVMAKGTYMRCGERNSFERSDIRLTLPPEALYEDLDFIYAVSSPLMGSYAPVHRLHNNSAPIHSFCDLEIKTTMLPASLQSKALIVKVEGPGRFTSIGGNFEGGSIKGRIREFGEYTVMTDTTAPVIKAVNIYPNKNVSKQKTISMKITDDLSGIKSYRGTLNGKWILMDYDAKRNLLTYSYDERIVTGKNSFQLVVTDNSGNVARYSASLVR